jgi:hypothetical protein
MVGVALAAATYAFLFFRLNWMDVLHYSWEKSW